MIAWRWPNAVLCMLVGAAGVLAIAIHLTDAGMTGKKQHQHGAHVHGSAKLDIAVEDRTATIEIESPAESIIGFEHKARTDADQQDQEHSEVRGTFAVTCDSPLAGSKVRFAFAKTFPAICAVQVQVVAATQQVGAMIKQDRGEVEVPR
jgi:hypothetical protein